MKVKHQLLAARIRPPMTNIIALLAIAVTIASCPLSPFGALLSVTNRLLAKRKLICCVLCFHGVAEFRRTLVFGCDAAATSDSDAPHPGRGNWHGAVITHAPNRAPHHFRSPQPPPGSLKQLKIWKRTLGPDKPCCCTPQPLLGKTRQQERCIQCRDRLPRSRRGW